MGWSRVCQPGQRGRIPGLNIAFGISALGVSVIKLLPLATHIRPDGIYSNHMIAKPIGVILGRVLDVPVVWHVRNIHGAGIEKMLSRPRYSSC
jgi:hypothetical protein